MYSTAHGVAALYKHEYVGGLVMLHKQAVRATCNRMPYMIFYRSISGLVVEYIVAIDVTRVRFPADAFAECTWLCF